MKKLVAALAAVPLFSLSGMALAAQPAPQDPMQLTADQMDAVTAGTGRRNAPWWQAWTPSSHSFNRAELFQINVSPVTIVQIGNNNTAIVFSGNFANIYQ